MLVEVLACQRFYFNSNHLLRDVKWGNWFQLISIDFNRFQWISIDFNEFLWISLNFNEFKLILMNFNEFQWIRMNFTGFHLISIDFNEFLWIWGGCTTLVCPKAKLNPSRSGPGPTRSRAGQFNSNPIAIQ